ncbi:MAG: HAD hydrolase-like protein [Ilumatobacteraceae bacterium]
MVPPIHVLLDLDGTITDSSPGIGASLRHAFTTCGYDAPTDDDIRAMIGPPFEMSFPKFGIRPTDIERVVETYRQRYEDVGLFESSLYEGVPQMFTDLSDAGYVISLATAKPQVTAIRIIEHYGLTGYFEVQAGATNEVGSSRRTKGEVIAHALHELGLTVHDGNHVVMVGDRDHDVEGASLNAMPCIGVTWGFGSERELTAAGAVTVVDDPSEVAAAVAATYRSGRP